MLLMNLYEQVMCQNQQILSFSTWHLSNMLYFIIIFWYIFKYQAAPNRLKNLIISIKL